MKLKLITVICIREHKNESSIWLLKFYNEDEGNNYTVSYLYLLRWTILLA